jgi:hypothetical protein
MSPVLVLYPVVSCPERKYGPMPKSFAGWFHFVGFCLCGVAALIWAVFMAFGMVHFHKFRPVLLLPLGVIVWAAVQEFRFYREETPQGRSVVEI